MDATMSRKLDLLGKYLIKTIDENELSVHSVIFQTLDALNELRDGSFEKLRSEVEAAVNHYFEA